jgi:hypothetical protein
MTMTLYSHNPDNASFVYCFIVSLGIHAVCICVFFFLADNTIAPERIESVNLPIKINFITKRNAIDTPIKPMIKSMGIHNPVLAHTFSTKYLEKQQKKKPLQKPTHAIVHNPTLIPNHIQQVVKPSENDKKPHKVSSSINGSSGGLLSSFAQTNFPVSQNTVYSTHNPNAIPDNSVLPIIEKKIDKHYTLDALFKKKFKQDWGDQRYLPQPSTFQGNRGEIVVFKISIDAQGKLVELYNESADQVSKNYEDVDAIVQAVLKDILPIDIPEGELGPWPYVFTVPITYSGTSDFWFK